MVVKQKRQTIKKRSGKKVNRTQKGGWGRLFRRKTRTPLESNLTSRGLKPVKKHKKNTKPVISAPIPLKIENISVHSPNEMRKLLLEIDTMEKQNLKDTQEYKNKTAEYDRHAELIRKKIWQTPGLYSLHVRYSQGRLNMSSNNARRAANEIKEIDNLYEKNRALRAEAGRIMEKNPSMSEVDAYRILFSRKQKLSNEYQTTEQERNQNV